MIRAYIIAPAHKSPFSQSLLVVALLRYLPSVAGSFPSPGSQLLLLGAMSYWGEQVLLGEAIDFSKHQVSLTTSTTRLAVDLDRKSLDGLVSVGDLGSGIGLSRGKPDV